MKEEFSKLGCLAVTIFLILFWILLILSFCSCEKSQPTSSGLPPQPNPIQPHIDKTGSVIFFMDYTTKGKIAPLMISTRNDTTCNRNLGIITAFPEGYPPCGSFWGKTVSDTIQYVIRYRVTAVLNGKTLYASGTAMLIPDQCNQVKIVLK